MLQDLGIPGRAQADRYHAPGISTLHYAPKGIDVETLEDLLAEWTRTQAPDEVPLALDGNTPRGSDEHNPNEDSVPRPVHLAEG